ncbi:MAG TPA: hypothetical protein VK464_22635 [Symbiobacteriaceae bacterium]|nr:hypothetical protein [Symbiobacteriaceae bacterium]
MGMPPRKTMQGSNGQVAEGGLDPEASFAELDEQTAARMGAEAEARTTQGRSAVDMLTSHVDDQLERSEEFRYSGPES